MSSVWTMFESWLAQRRDNNFAADMTPVVESDLALTRHEVEDFLSNRPDTRQRLLQMASRFGLGADQIDAERWMALDLTRTCGHCANEKTCRKFLARDDDLDKAKTFCPNARRYEAMADGLHKSG